MNPLATYAFACAVLVAFVPAWAQPSKGAKWAQEPRSVFGLQLGTRVDLTDLHDCGGPAVAPEQTSPPKFGFCKLDQGGQPDAFVSVGGFPVYVFRDGMLTIRDGIATSLLIVGRHSDFDEIRTVLVERYGQPTATWRDDAKTRGGASFSSQNLAWRGRAIQITLTERSGTIDQSTVHFSHIPSAARAEQQRKDRAKTDASKM